jgi:ribosome biogenesis protein Nip4
VWVKPSGELPFLYGNHVLKAHLGRITEDTPEHQGVVVFNMSDVPLVSGSDLSYLDSVASGRVLLDQSVRRGN